MSQQSTGKVVTFYSFKGGVGRTMALANVAFLAAHNGNKVLVMDWDLEAPGLAYYFRGLHDAPHARALKGTPGVLNMAWDWAINVRSKSELSSPDEIISSLSDFPQFERYVTPLAEGDALPTRARLDYISSGSPLISTPEQISYEEALAKFSWA